MDKENFKSVKEDDVKKKDLLIDLTYLAGQLDTINKVNHKTAIKFQWLAIIIIVLEITNIVLHILLITKNG